MSEIKVNSIKGVGASSAAITVNNTDGSCTANLSNRQNRNLIINGAMQVAERGTTNTAGGDGYFTVDRMYYYNAGIDNDVTKAQADVASGTTPYSLGFRKSFKITNGNQTSPGSGDEILIRQNIEAQDIANSGWNYTSSSSFITLQYWIKSSVSQNFYVNLMSIDGTQQNYVTETGTLTADTWTKVTKTIPGNSNLQFDNNNEKGLFIQWNVYRGTQATGTRPLNAWAAYSSSSRVPDMASTWWINTGATFEITGVQLEVGSHATDFEHRSFAQELQLCRRYYQVILDRTTDSGDDSGLGGTVYTSNGGVLVPIRFNPVMRTAPSVESSSAGNEFRTRHGDLVNFDSFTGFNTVSRRGGTLITSTAGNKVVGDFYWIETDQGSAKLALVAEL